MKKIKPKMLLWLLLPVMLLFCGCDGDKNNTNNGGSASYTVTFMVEGVIYDTKEVLGGNKVEQPTDPNLSNYLFKGWFFEGEKWSFLDTAVNKHITLTAKFDYGYTYEETVVTGISDYGKTLTELNIADGMTEISRGAFLNCSHLQSVTIPNSVEIIWIDSFKGCSGLERLTTPFVGGSETYNAYLGYIFGASTYLQNNNYVPSSLKKVTLTNCTSIENYAFYDCTNLTDIEIPNSVIRMGVSSIAYCENLTTITIPSGVTRIDDFAFAYCESLANVIFAENSKLESIGEGSFRDCFSLTEIELPSSLISIGEECFLNCEDLVNVEFGENSKLENIGSKAFAYCDCLSNIVIPSNVRRIDDRVFIDCKNLTSVTFEKSTGWIVSTNKNMYSPITLLSADLLNESTSATYLTSTYYDYYWAQAV